MESTGSETLSHPLLRRVLSGRYEIRDVVGAGGMATVFLAWDRRLGRQVAVKVLHPQFAADREFVERFQREAQFAAQLSSHPNVVAIHDVVNDGEIHYIVMELVEGRNLKEIIAQEGPLPVRHAFGIGEQIASALGLAHARGLVHRDIKPQNILVAEDGRVKVTDFGIAHAEHAAHLTRPGMVLGTAEYLSPEQAMGGAAGPSSDLYSLGVVLYEILTGHLPFTAETPMGVAMQHVHAQPPPLDRVPPGAAAVVLRALSKKPSDRHRSASELEQALRQRFPAVDPTTYRPLEQQTALLAGSGDQDGQAGRRGFPRAWLLLPLLLLLAVGALSVRLVPGAHSSPRHTPVRTARSTPISRPAVIHRSPTATALPAPSPTPAPPPTAAPAFPPPAPKHGHHGEKDHGKGKGEGEQHGKGGEGG